MKIDRTGASRLVILTERWAFKFPVVRDCANQWSWKYFCLGMLANMQECVFSAAKWPELCPVRFSLPLGLLVVMPRVRLMTQAEFDTWDVDTFIDTGDCLVPTEKKPNSFGWLNGNIVCIDYGN